MKIQEAARLTGVTERTLRYYDRIGLLHPSGMTESGYRLYDEDALRRLQQILFFRELGFPLAQIREIMDSPGYDRSDALRRHRALLAAEHRLLQRRNALRRPDPRAHRAAQQPQRQRPAGLFPHGNHLPPEAVYAGAGQL